MPRRVTLEGSSPAMSWPLNHIFPDVGGYTPVMALKRVVLPAPFGPMSATISFRSTLKSTWFTATRPPKALVTWLASRMTCR